MTARDPMIDVPVRDLDEEGRVIHYRATFGSIPEKLGLLADLARAGLDRNDRFGAPRLARERAAEFAGRSDRAMATARALFLFVRDEIAYHAEPMQRFGSAAYTLHVKQGDCGAKGVLLATLTAAVGISCALRAVGGLRNDPAHVTTALCADGKGATIVLPWLPFERPELWPNALPAGYEWAETTIAARLGESPIDAMARLGIRR